MREALIDQPEIEYLDGRAYPKVSPKRTHAVVQGALWGVLQRAAGDRGVVGPEWRFRLSSGTELVPDVAYVSYERLRRLSDAEAEEPPFAPDIAGEVRSPSHRAGLAAKKIELYFTHGALLVLDVDPVRRIVYAHTADGATYVYRSGEQFSCEAVPWLQFEVAELFKRVDIPR